jgi:hypothetical protein
MKNVRKIFTNNLVKHASAIVNLASDRKKASSYITKHLKEMEDAYLLRMLDTGGQVLIYDLRKANVFSIKPGTNLILLFEIFKSFPIFVKK